MAESIARQFARWTAALRYEDLPPAVVDKMRAQILVHLVSAVFGAQTHQGQDSVQLTLAEEGKSDGASIVHESSKATRIGATFANAELIHVTGLMDQYRMITHPGVSLIPAGIVNAELEGRSGKELITALAAGYEFGCRLAEDFVPATAARGFRPAPIYHTMGAAVVAGKLMGLDETGMMATIAIAANCASGLFEAGRSGGGDQSIHDPNAARQGVFAAVMARQGHVKGAEQIIEGPAGFYNAFTGSHTGKLSYRFQGPLQADMEAITSELGSRWQLLQLMYRMYNTGGYNHQVINLLAEMKQQHAWDAAAIREVVVTMNFLETMYPSPPFPRQPGNPPIVGSTHYFAAHAAVNGGFPQVGGSTFGPTGDDVEHDATVLDFMKTRVRVVGAVEWPMFSPSITVHLNDGRALTGTYPYERMLWNYEHLVERLKDSGPRYPLGGATGMAALVDLVRGVDDMPSVEPLLRATRP